MGGRVGAVTARRPVVFATMIAPDPGYTVRALGSRPTGGPMRTAHTVETVRAAEHALMARLPDGALMRRAAFGLAVVCVRILPRVSGARVVLLVGSGDNGGDALFAGAELARRGAAVTAVAAGRSPHPRGLAALRAAGGRTAAVAEAAAL